ncbi:MAG: hypothetical protein VX438_07585, partial [Planctomycetota bacterium]|nr:hypothetical protein [Planctomycetota bacterium]
MSQLPDPKPRKKKLRVREVNDSSQEPSEELTRGYRKKFEGLARLLIAVSLIGSPWYFGSVDAISQLVIAVGLAVCLIIWLAVSFLKSKVIWRAHFISLL